MEYIIDLRVVYDTSTRYIKLIDNDESSIRISNAASRLLIEMLTYPNTPLKREVLIEKVWEEHGFSGSSISLNVAVSEIRKAFKLLGIDTPPIKTISRVGFCFISPVKIQLFSSGGVKDTTSSSFLLLFSSHLKNLLQRMKTHPLAIIYCMFLPLLFLAVAYPIEQPNQLQQKLILLGEQGRCTLYSLDVDKHIDDETERRIASQALQINNVDCKNSSADIYFSLRSDTVPHSAFLGVCYLGSESKYTQCITYKTINGK